MAEPSLSTLERLRLEAGLSRPAVQAATGIDRKTVYRLELCLSAAPHFQTINRLAKFYGVRPEWLMREYHQNRYERMLAREAA